MTKDALIAEHIAKNRILRKKRKPIHPNIHVVYIQTFDGKRFPTISTYGKEGDVLISDCDFNTHPAWSTKQTSTVNLRDQNVAKFRKKGGAAMYASIFDSMSQKPTTEDKTEK